MTAVPIERESELAAGSQAVSQPTQEAVVIGQTLTSSDQEHAPAAAQVDGAKERAALRSFR
jgi:hypothetical protein